MRMAFREYVELTGMIESVYHEAALKLNLTDSEMDVLYVLCAHEPGCYQSILCKETGRTKSTINSTVKKMEREGIVYLTPGEGRNTCVFLTEQGKQLMEHTVYKIIDMENEIYESWTQEEQQLFLQLNRDYVEKLGEMVKEL